MGKQSRLRRMRREIRAASGPPGEPLRILRSLHRSIQSHCSESNRRCWEYLVEILAISSGWDTETNESQHLWEKIGNDSRWVDFVGTWVTEVEQAKASGNAFSEPIGQLLEEIGGANGALGQFFTPMPVVRMMNAITMNDIGEAEPRIDGMPSYRAIDPCCGTGRFMIDALVHYDNVMMHGIDLDLWALRTAMLNIRLLCKWTTLRLKDPEDRLRPLRRSRKLIERVATNPFAAAERDMIASERAVPGKETDGDAGGDILVIGGRAIFMHGDALIVDTDYAPNWLCAGWSWTPHPWHWNLKMRGYYGSYDDWQRAGCPPLDEIARADREEIQFDYSMRPAAAAP